MFHTLRVASLPPPTSVARPPVASAAKDWPGSRHPQPEGGAASRPLKEVADQNQPRTDSMAHQNRIAVFPQNHAAPDPASTAPSPRERKTYRCWRFDRLMYSSFEQD